VALKPTHRKCSLVAGSVLLSFVTRERRDQRGKVGSWRTLAAILGGHIAFQVFAGSSMHCSQVTV
jgi:hypothetical protein